MADLRTEIFNRMMNANPLPADAGEAADNMADAILNADNLPAAGGANWQSLLELDYLAEASATPTDNVMAVGGVDHHLYNGTEGQGMEQVNGTGLHCATDDSRTVDVGWYQSLANAPSWAIQLEELSGYLGTDRVRAAIEFDYAEDGGGVSELASIGFFPFERTSPTPPALEAHGQPHGLVVRGRNTGNASLAALRATKPTNSSVTIPASLFVEAGLTDLARLSLMIEWDLGRFRGWIGGARSGGNWPAWRFLGTVMPTQNTAWGDSAWTGTDKLGLVIAAEADRTSGSDANVEMDVRHLQVWRSPT